MPQLDFATYPLASQLFWLIISFAVLYFAMAKVALPELHYIITERNKIISDNIAKAHELEKVAKSYAENYDAKLKEAQHQANDLFQKASEKVTQKIEKNNALIDAEAAKLYEKSNKAIEKIKTQSEKEIISAASVISKAIISQTVGLIANDNDINKHIKKHYDAF
jgi:F-type H+-transporting ATPase subunit b